jgi:hypothetical protein
MYFTSDLGSALAAPEQPQAVSPVHAMLTTVSGLLVGGFLLLVFAVLDAQQLIAVPASAISIGRFATIAWFGGLIPLWAVATVLINRRQMMAARPQWKAAIERWRRLYYCSRDDVVFLPRERQVSSPEHIAEFLRAGVAVERRQPWRAR